MQIVDIKEIVPYQGPYSGLLHRLVANPDTGFDQFEIVYGTLDKGLGGGMHSHPDSEKFQFVLEGLLEVTDTNGTVFQVPAGSGILFPKGEEHEAKNGYDGMTGFLVFYSPPRSDADKTKPKSK